MDYEGEDGSVSGTAGEDGEDDIPGFLPDIEFEVKYITIEYSLHEREWWLARRFAFEGEARVGRWIGVPFLIETTLTGYSVNPVEPELARDAMEEEGWRSGSAQRERRGEGQVGEEIDSVISMVPPLDSLDASGLLGELDELEMGAVVFDEAEIDRIRRDLELIVGQVQVSYRPSFDYGFDNGLWRFNRVEGLSLGLRGGMPIAPLVEASATGRIGVADWQPRGEVRVERALDESSLHWAAYRRLSGASDFDDPLDGPSSVKALFIGRDRGQFYDAYGTEVGSSWLGRSIGVQMRIFVEEHQAVEPETSFHLFKPITEDRAADNITADEGRIGGMEVSLRWSRGTDPAGLSAWGSLVGEAASGDFEYQRAFATLGTSLPTVLRVASALEFAAGTTWGAPPIQRLHYIGGGGTVRGFAESSLAGEAFWYGRAEVASAFPAFRLAFFGDAGWAGPRDDFTLDDPWVGVGTGASMLDGVVRIDLARGVRRGGAWRLYLYLDGIL